MPSTPSWTASAASAREDACIQTRAPAACSWSTQRLRWQIVMKRDELDSQGNALINVSVSRRGIGRHFSADEVDAEQTIRQRTNAVNHDRQTGRRLARRPK